MVAGSKKFPKLFEPGQIGKVTIRNRIVMLPVHITFWTATGEVTERVIDHFAARARGGAGLIVVSQANPSYPPGYPVMASLESERMVAGHYRLMEKLHAYGARVALQISQLGRQLNREDLDIVSSSPVRCVDFAGVTYPVPRALEKDEIREFIRRFALIAANARRAGYDMVEVHCAHGYLLSSFISPYLNTRDDEYGGSLQNRMRFPLEVIRRIKEVTGNDYPVGVRINGDEFVKGGITTEESPAIAQIFEEAGVAFLDVSSGIEEMGHKRIDIMRMPEGWKAYLWEAVKKAVKIPTFAGGGNRTPELCEKIIAEGKADFVGLGRQFYADPEWPNKVREGRLGDIRKCTSCLECRRAVDIRCSINVALGREKEFGEIKPAPVKKRVMVIGAGPGGMEAARIAALRGHQVTLYDRRREIGGNLLRAASPPGKEKLLWFRDYEAGQLSNLGVSLKLGVKVTPELVDKIKPDVVILAAGSNPVIPGIPGIEGENVSTAWEVLESKTKIRNQDVVVAGGGMVGAETAEFLAEQNNVVTIVEMLPRIADDMEIFNRRGLMDALREKKVIMLTEREVSEVTEEGLIVTNKRSGERKLVKADWVVLAMGSKPAGELVEALPEKVPQLYVVGDCQQPRTIMAAVYEGAFTALQI